MFKFALFRNHLTGNDNDYLAVPQSTENKRTEDIIHQITIPGSILKETECAAVINDFFKAIASNLQEGVGFTNEFIRINPGVSGVFNGINDQFDPNRHHKQVNVVGGKEFKAAVEEMPVEKVAASVRQPEIKSVYDFKSQQNNAVLTPGHMIELRGRLLKLDTELTDEGIFIVNTTDDSEFKIVQIHTNLPSKLLGMLPDELAPGVYNLVVRNRPEGNKNLMSGSLTEGLTVS